MLSRQHHFICSILSKFTSLITLDPCNVSKTENYCWEVIVSTMAVIWRWFVQTRHANWCLISRMLANWLCLCIFMRRRSWRSTLWMWLATREGMLETWRLWWAIWRQNTCLFIPILAFSTIVMRKVPGSACDNYINDPWKHRNWRTKTHWREERVRNDKRCEEQNRRRRVTTTPTTWSITNTELINHGKGDIVQSNFSLAHFSLETTNWIPRKIPIQEKPFIYREKKAHTTNPILCSQAMQNDVSRIWSQP